MIRILRRFARTGVSLMTACAFSFASHATAWDRADAAPTQASASWGEAAARDIARWYGDTRDDCGEGRPAYLCTGVMFRGQGTMTNAFHSWTVSPASKASGGVSFAYIRRDGKFQWAWMGVGFILEPQQEAAVGTETIRTLCIFPTDGHTDLRSDRGCGTYPGIAASAPCGNITEARQWIALFPNFTVHSWPSTCGFDVIDKEGDTDAKNFILALRAKTLLGGEGFYVHAEIRVVSWKDDVGHRLPIAAFYYSPRNSSGVAEATLLYWAKYYQEDYYQATGIAVPIIRLDFPPTTSDDLVPVYEDAKQAIRPPAFGELRLNVLEASGNGSDALTLAQLGNAEHFHVGVPPYAGMATGDTVGIRIAGDAAEETRPVEVHSIGITSLPLPYERLIQSTGGGLTVQAVVHHADGRTETSAPRTIAIQAQPFAPPAPAYLDASDRLSIRWPHQQAGDHVRVFWGGIPFHKTDPIAITPGEPLMIPVRQDWLRENLGRTVPIHYEVTDAQGQVKAFSLSLNVAVPAADRLDAPTLPEGADDVIPPDASSAEIEIRLPDGQRGDEIAVSIDAPHPLQDTLLVRAAGEPVALHLDRAWLESNRGADIVVTYAVDRGGNRIGTSYPAVITIGVGP